ncbi:hypothetical protein ACTRXD_01325 [Nitrospira sp. T9]|uniref:hypothetical protein n=1 Tax=unclassified Nitrospira TaxID=2652172 RepID=UPI003F94ABC6
MSYENLSVSASGLKYKEFNDPGKAIRAVASGICHAAKVPKLMDPKEADKQAEIILSDYDLRSDGVPGGTLGASLFGFPNNPLEYFKESIKANARILKNIGGVQVQLQNALDSFESLSQDEMHPENSYRIKPVTHRGMSAAFYRALIFSSRSTVIVPIHEDLANVRALAPYNFEIASTDMILAHNLYLRNRPGEGTLFVYGKQLTEQDKRDLDAARGLNIFKTGYPYPEDIFKDSFMQEIEVETGDYVVFRADYPHKVANKNIAKNTDEHFRVSWNGFMTLLYGQENQLVYWT